MSSELGVERPTTLPLPEPQEERRVHFGDVNSACLVREERTHSTSTHCARDPEFRPKRIRSASFSAGEFRHGNKKRRRYRVLPSKFLLGGNITDPLNLGSLDREGVSQLGLVEASVGAITKKSDAVRVIIPPNINDPLNLDVSSENEDSFTDALQKQFRKRRRNRKRKRRLSEPSGDTVECEPGESFEESVPIRKDDEAKPADSVIPQILPKISSSSSVDTLKPLTINTELPTPPAASAASASEEQRDSMGPVTPVGAKPSTSGFQRPAFKKQRSKCDNKIVSPVIPQPGVERKRHPSHSRHNADKPHLSQQNLKLPKKFNPKNELFQYGNYNKYYGYRNPDMTTDLRLRYLKREWFDGKEVLDVGCNIGHITLTVARDYNPKRVVGIDIDKKLINIAQKNIKHYLQKGDIQETNFPKSMRLLYGPLKPPVTADGARHFPYNIKFVHSNYVMESDELLETVRPEFDLIMCLSISKWIHLNWGDSGLKRFFRRIFYNLKPGGRFIFEPQGWPSYNKRRKLTMRIFENYKNIRLFPDKFNDYLLHTVGFSTSEKIITPQHTSRGFQRPIIVYTKAGGGSTKSSSLEDSYSRDSSTKQGNTTESGMNNVSNNENIRTAQEQITEKCQETTDKCDNNGMKPTPNNSKKVELDDAAQGNDAACTDGSSCSKSNSSNNKVMVEAMGVCVSKSQVETLESRGQSGLRGSSKRESDDDYVCDNINRRKSSGEVGGGGGSCLTHSLNHKLNPCVVQSPCSSQSKILNTNKNANNCTKMEVLKTHESPITKEAYSDCKEDISHQDEKLLKSVDRRSEGESKERTSLGSIDKDSSVSGGGGAATNENVDECATQDTVTCEKSKNVFDKKEEANKNESLLLMSEARSPEKDKNNEDKP